MAVKTTKKKATKKNTPGKAAKGKAAAKVAAKAKAAAKAQAAAKKIAAQKAAAKKAAAKAAKAAKASRLAARAAARKAIAERKARLKASKAANKAAKAEARRQKIAARKAREAERRAKQAERKAQIKAKKAAAIAAIKAAAAEKKAAKEAERKARALARATAIGEQISRAAGKAARRLKQAAPVIETTEDIDTLPPAPVFADGVVIRGLMRERYDEVLTLEAQAFLAGLHRNFDATRKALLAERAEKQKRYDEGALPDFLPETAQLRDDEWQVAPIPEDLQNRRVEITGPVDRKMIVNALNSGATHYMADFEDANSPTWVNCIEGQINLKDYWAGQIGFTDPDTKKKYDVGLIRAVLIVRPRGWHLDEVHFEVDGQPISASLFDFGLYFFHNALKTTSAGSGPYFYLPKLESHQEARLWNDVFLFAQKHISVWPGTIKATVLIETLPAAFEMDEILHELREHIAGMNAGRWDYIFSFIKTFAKNPDYILPDRSQVVMGEAFLGAYAALLVRTCHRRGAFAMGGMAAQIPIKGDEAANTAAFDKVRADKEREVRDGYDGTWVAHPGLVPVAKEVFDRMMPEPNQVSRVRLHVRVLRDDMLKLHEGARTEEGFRLNIRVGVQYLEAWLSGRGAVPIYNLMEDAATAEISRAQIWQWMKYGAVLDTGMKVTRTFFERAMHEEMIKIKNEVGPRYFAKGRFAEAEKLFRQLAVAREFEPFLTIPAYKLIA
jgi:malate synthase